MRKLMQFVLILASLVTPVAHASDPPVLNVERQAVARADGKPVTAEQVKNAIVSAGGLRGWIITPDRDGHMIGNITVRNKHTAKIDINYDSGGFSIKYLDSTNLDFSKDENGKEVIHKNYNRWINNLRHDTVNAIRALIN